MFSKFEFVLYATVSLVQLVPSLAYKYLIKRDFDEKYNETISKANFSDHVVIVTGSNTGIGKYTAKTIANLGGTVILACRDPNKAKEVADEIELSLKRLSGSSSPSYKVVFIQLDLSSLYSVIEFVEQVHLLFPRVDVLINNAGTNIPGKSSDGLEQLFQINYLGHFLLTTLLEPLLSTKRNSEDTSSGRVVNLSSVMHHIGQPGFQNNDYIPFSKPSKYDYYSDSKLYMNFLTLEINRRLATRVGSGRSIRSVACNPGAVRSDIWRHTPFIVKGIYDIIMRILYLSSEQGCATSVYGALMSDSELISYQFRNNHLLTESDSKAVRWTYHPYVPYLVPYSMPWNILSFEIIGPFAEPSFARSSLPANSNALAVKLWDTSKQVCLAKLKAILPDNKYSKIEKQLNSL